MREGEKELEVEEEKVPSLHVQHVSNCLTSSGKHHMDEGHCLMLVGGNYS